MLEKNRVKASITTLMATFMKDLGFRDKNMEREGIIFFPWMKFMKEIFPKTKKMDLESIIFQMEKFIKGILKMV